MHTHAERKQGSQKGREEDNKCLPALRTWEARQEKQKFEAGLGLKECKASLCDRRPPLTNDQRDGSGGGVGCFNSHLLGVIW